MATSIRAVEYFYATVKDQPGQACRFLSEMATAGVNLHAFNIVPVGLAQTQLIMFPEDSEQLRLAAESRKLEVTGPQRAFLIQGDDELGALMGIHCQLAEAKINVYASSGVTDGRGGYGYIVYVRGEDFDRAREILEA